VVALLAAAERIVDLAQKQQLKIISTTTSYDFNTSNQKWCF